MEKERFGEGVNFKNQVITIKDFGLLDSKRTSGVSELSIEKNLENVVMTEKEAEMGKQ